MASTVLESALHLLSLGMALVPLAPREKGPRGNGWNLPENLITTPERAQPVFAAPRNVGVQLGASGILSLDVDDLESARVEFARAELDLDAIMSLHPHPISARGSRFWYRIPPGIALQGVRARRVPGTDGKLMTSYELRTGNGAQDVAPGSVHPLGMEYTWSKGAPSCRDDLPLAPLELIDLYTSLGTAKPGGPRRTGRIGEGGAIRSPSGRSRASRAFCLARRSSCSQGSASTRRMRPTG